MYPSIISSSRQVPTIRTSLPFSAAGNASGRWLLSLDGGYLCSASNGNALTTTTSASSRNANWTVSFDGSGIATLEAQGGSSKLLRYNRSNPRFSCYKSSSTQQTQNVRIFRRVQGVKPVEDDPLAENDTYGCYIQGYERLYVKGTDQYSRTVEKDGTVTFAILNAAGKEQLVISGFDPALAKGGAASVSVRYRKGYKVLLDKTYSLEVVREEGPKVWLGDGTGQGFIIKK